MNKVRCGKLFRKRIAAQVAVSHLAEFRVDDREQPFDGIRIAPLGGQQHLRRRTHKCTACDRNRYAAEIRRNDEFLSMPE